MVGVILGIQDMPQHQRGGFGGLGRKQLLAVAEAPPVGHPLYRIVTQAIARFEFGVAEERRREHGRTGAVGIGFERDRKSLNDRTRTADTAGTSRADASWHTAVSSCAPAPGA